MYLRVCIYRLLIFQDQSSSLSCGLQVIFIDGLLCINIFYLECILLAIGMLIMIRSSWNWRRIWSLPRPFLRSNYLPILEYKFSPSPNKHGMYQPFFHKSQNYSPNSSSTWRKRTTGAPVAAANPKSMQSKISWITFRSWCSVKKDMRDNTGRMIDVGFSPAFCIISFSSNALLSVLYRMVLLPWAKL